MEKKYEIIESDSTEAGGSILHRIKALIDFGTVKKGDLGGFIEKEENLSHEGDCWVFENACVYGNAKISNNAKIYGYAQIFDNANVFSQAQVFGYARVYGKSAVYDRSQVFDHAWIHGEAKISGKAKVYGNAAVYNNASILGTSSVYGDAIIKGSAIVNSNAKVFGDIIIHGNTCIEMNGYINKFSDILSIDTIGLKDSQFTFYKDREGTIYVSSNEFNGIMYTVMREIAQSDRMDKSLKNLYLNTLMYANLVLG